jgi:hypothetical protein
VLYKKLQIKASGHSVPKALLSIHRSAVTNFGDGGREGQRGESNFSHMADFYTSTYGEGF